MTTGVWLTKNIIGLSLFFSIQGFARNQMEEAHNPTITKKQPIEIFNNDLHPFLQKQCSECHGDNAYYPVGPKHSQSNQQAAYQIFTSLLDPNSYMNSKFIKIASNKHYCRTYKFNCENEEQVDKDLKELFTLYVGAATAAKTNPKPKDIKQKVSKADSSFSILANEPTTFNEQILLDNLALTVTTKVRIYKTDFIKLVSVSLSSSQKIDLTLEGIEIKINDYVPTKDTGLENLSRTLSFDGVGLMTTKLTLTREVILKAKPGDKLTVKLLGLKPKDISTIVAPCLEDAYAERIVKNINPYLSIVSQMVYGDLNETSLDQDKTILSSQNRSAKQICEQVLLRINKDIPSQSVLVQQMPKELQANMVADVQKWTSDVVDDRVFEPVLLTANYYNSFCYALAFYVYCFGDKNGDAETKPIYVRNGIKDLKVGNSLVAIKDALNKWIFVGERFGMPESLDFLNGDNILDLQMSYQLICYLSTDYELYCGGRDKYSILSSRSSGSVSRNGFEKISDLKFKSFDMKTGNLKAIGMDGKLYFWGRINIESRSFSKFTNYDRIYELDFNQQVESFSQYDDSFAVMTSNGKLYGYSIDLDEAKFRNRFGKNHINGDEISEAYKFIQFEIWYKGICGLTAEKELFCRGDLPKGLKYQNSLNENSESFDKVSNIPKNFKKIFFGSSTFCFLLETNEITCAGNNGSNGIPGDLTDDTGRVIYTGENKLMNFQAPNIISPIK